MELSEIVLDFYVIQGDEENFNIVGKYMHTMVNIISPLQSIELN